MRTEIIGYDSGWGCGDFGCEDGPTAVQADSLLLKLQNLGIPAKWRGPLGLRHLGVHALLDTKEKTLPLVTEGLRRLANHIRHAVQNGSTPVVIGGDHASAIGTWSGVVEATCSHGRFGLIWVDAHLDCHTAETSYQGKWGGWWHGQPVTALLGHGLVSFTTMGGAKPKISPQHLSIIGPHSFEPAEVEFTKKHGIRVYYLEEVQQRGFKAVFEEALARATTGTDAFGLTVDLDAFRTADAPGVGTSEENGLVAAEVLPIIKSLAHKSGFVALEIAEFNPHNDVQNKTALLIEKLVESVFTKA